MDMKNNVKVAQSVAPQSSAAATLTGAALDVSGFSNVLGLVSAGAIGASTTVSADLEVSDSPSSGFTVAASITQLGATDDNKMGVVLEYKRLHGGAKKYVRLVITVAGSNTALVAGVLVAGHPAQAPTS